MYSSNIHSTSRQCTKEHELQGHVISPPPTPPLQNSTIDKVNYKCIFRGYEMKVLRQKVPFPWFLNRWPCLSSHATVLEAPSWWLTATCILQDSPLPSEIGYFFACYLVSCIRAHPLPVGLPMEPKSSSKSFSISFSLQHCYLQCSDCQRCQR